VAYYCSAAYRHADALEIDRAELEKRLDKNKTAYAAELVKRLAADATLAPRFPKAFRDAINDLRGLV
jgi:hypothetical protein